MRRHGAGARLSAFNIWTYSAAARQGRGFARVRRTGLWAV